MRKISSGSYASITKVNSIFTTFKNENGFSKISVAWFIHGLASDNLPD